MFTPLTYDNTFDTIFSLYFLIFKVYVTATQARRSWLMLILADQFLKSNNFFYACIKYSLTFLISVLATDQGRTKYLQEGKGKRLFSFLFVYLLKSIVASLLSSIN